MAATFSRRDEIKQQLAERLKQHSAQHWLAIMEPADVWCAQVLDWPQLLKSEAFKVLKMAQKVTRGGGVELTTTRCPIRIDGQLLNSPTGSPKLGQQNASLESELG